MESARRFRALLSELGLKMPDAAKSLHVSLRTLHNWSTGVHEVPYSALKLLRLQRHMELPAPWSGWHFSRGHLVTPEGRTIAHHEGSWWSLMVLRARSYDKLAQRIKMIEAAAHGPIAVPVGSWDNGSCTQQSPLPAQALAIVPPVGNTGGTNPKLAIVVAGRYQPDTIQTLWQLPSGSRLKSNPSQKPTASGLESPSIPSSASHLTPIYNVQSRSLSVPQLRYSLSLSPLPKPLPQALLPLQSSQSSGTSSPAKSLCSPLHHGGHQSPSRSSVPIRLKLNAPSWPTGIGAIRPSSLGKGGVL
jgi:hypothetical protein